MTIYNFKNRVTISITKPQLKVISEELSMDIKKLDDIINKILSETHDATMQDLNSWIDTHIPFLPSMLISINDKNSKDPFTEDLMEELNNWIENSETLTPQARILLQTKNSQNDINTDKSLRRKPEKLSAEEKEEIFEFINSLTRIVIEDSGISYFIPTMLRDNIKANLASSFVKDGRFYRIKLGTFIIRDLIAPLNEDENSNSYHFMERMVDFACERTHFYLERNIARYCSDVKVMERFTPFLSITCIKD